MTITRSDWEQRFQSLNIESRAFIDGQYCAAASGATFECVSPVDGRFLANVASTDEADANAAVAVARRTFESGVWANLAPVERKRILIRFADLILANQEELALLETLDMGKPISDSMGIDIPATANAIRWTAEAIDKIYDEVAATPHDQLGLVTREPLSPPYSSGLPGGNPTCLPLSHPGPPVSNCRS
ncbi:aldehyde dehydrogenase family protein, partial [Pseudomonas sp. NPDC089569]|uniref:aldehyde dehydrogenase family protein n=1 Tax=Pseudomonas sp. NPDC089569 TaxID=3390722 RepID=UPI003CFED68F